MTVCGYVESLDRTGALYCFPVSQPWSLDARPFVDPLHCLPIQILVKASTVFFTILFKNPRFNFYLNKTVRGNERCAYFDTYLFTYIVPLSNWYINSG